ncbi:hypothetical protein Q5P01_007050 [Channa striata]|uniref:Uncharacterized protein n=1 Tax=Channa striata TaxID=64152 RepID=A0AA88N7F5_CHASR|nr:hypothetical protein Q5P01_007050 [Channa striata]
MEAAGTLLICVLTLWFTQGSCLPADATDKGHDNELHKRLTDLSPSDVSMKEALRLFHSVESVLEQRAEEETNGKEVKALGHLTIKQPANRNIRNWYLVRTTPTHYLTTRAGTSTTNTRATTRASTSTTTRASMSTIRATTRAGTSSRVPPTRPL